VFNTIYFSYKLDFFFFKFVNKLHEPKVRAKSFLRVREVIFFGYMFFLACGGALRAPPFF